ncbi:unnamed protein product, partial [Rotaria sp. Silwood2]
MFDPPKSLTMEG